MSHRTNRFTLAVCALATLCMFALPAASGAKKHKHHKKPAGYKVMVATKTVSASGESATANATCPAGTTVSGGGAKTTGSDAAIRDYGPVASDARVWRAHPSGFDTPEPDGTLTAYALCVKGLKVTRSVDSEQIPENDSDEHTVNAVCAGQPLGGGITATTQMQIFSDLAIGTSWRSAGAVIGSAEPVTFASTALCAKKVTLLRKETRVTIPASQLIPVAKSATASCPRGTLRTGGGFQVSHVPGQAIGVSATSPTGARSWTVNATNGADFASATLTVQVTCLKQKVAKKHKKRKPKKK